MQELLPIRVMVREILQHFKLDYKGTFTHSTVFEDNNEALQLANAPKMTPRSKHIPFKYHFFCEHVKNGSVSVVYVDPDEQVADIFTKRLPAGKFYTCCKILMAW